MNDTCVCRCCGKQYSEFKSSADWKGYCAQACVHTMAKRLGYRKNDPARRSEYDALRRGGEIGSVYARP